MKDNLFTIGEISKISGLTIKALRFYDRIGLLDPYKVDEFTGYRYYHVSQLMHIDIIIAARNMGISPNSLVPLFKAGDSEGLVNLLSGRKEDARKHIAELWRTIEGIEGIESTLGSGRSALTEHGIYKKHIDERHAITYPYDNNKSREDLVLDMHRLEVSAVKSGHINTYESGILFGNSGGDFYPAHLFTGIAKASASDDYVHIPEGEFICVNYTEINARNKMDDLGKYILRNGIEPESLIQVELLGDLFDTDNGFFELQARLPVVSR